jgi:hypothetical protein
VLIEKRPSDDGIPGIVSQPMGQGLSVGVR